jgi:glycosyltransferase involved in cell wall biosynthesis
MIPRNFSTMRSVLDLKPECSAQKIRDDLPANVPKGGLYFHGQYKNDQLEYPLVTVVTVEKNAAEGLEGTILSVLNQDYPNIEYIVVDGASQQETLNCIRKYEDALDVWISQPDTGFYQGLNNAIRMANGQYLHVLNADDFYLDRRTVSRFVKAFQKTECDLAYCDTLMVDRENGGGWIRYSQLTRFHLANGGFPQQAFFYRKSLFDKFGMFDESFRVVGDYDFLLKAIIKHNVPKFYLNAPLVVFIKGGMSEKPNEEERLKAVSRYYSRWELRLFTRKWFRKCFDSVDCKYRIRPFEWFVRKIFHLWTT